MKKFRTKVISINIYHFQQICFFKVPNNWTNLSDVIGTLQILLYLSYKIKFLVLLAFLLIYYLVKVETITFIITLIYKYFVIKFVP